ncbi:MAG: hypothetical protein KME28_08070 [Pelatocladus maniniholoensis HA4357-MV3]|uniref:Uncharacterized protein n=1 Tax=Pelatocladus maniniholoensis HA4357-MV3 TaxID=1117104 RepID=A0A9E3H6R1_9NOST|nr:hypothetical protein [Pelatocladus maniniholoensis HA4357-MV3]
MHFFIKITLAPTTHQYLFWPTTSDPLYRLVGDRQNANTTPFLPQTTV